MLRYEVLKLVALLASITGLAAPVAHAVLIDDFSTAPITLVRDTSVVFQSQTGLDPAHVVGGARHLRVGAFGTTGQTLTVDALTKTLQFASGVTGYGYLDVNYGTAAAPLDLNLTAGGATHLEIVFQNVGVIPYNVDKPPGVSITSGQQAATMFLPLSPGVPLGNGRYRSRMPLNVHPNIDFEDINTLAVSVGRYSPEGVLTLYSIQTVAIPEPATGLLLAAGVGLLSIAVRRR